MQVTDAMVSAARAAYWAREFTDIDPMRAALIAALAEMWRPISEAPKDGTWIMVFEPSDAAPNVHVVRWGVPEWVGGDNTWVTMALGPNPDTYDANNATHFMPLPAPPSRP